MYMIKALAIFVAVAVLLYMAVRWIINSEEHDADSEAWIKKYSASTLFLAFYEKHPYTKMSKVITMFEKEYPQEVAKINETTRQREYNLQDKREKYLSLQVQFQDELDTLCQAGAKWFTKAELLPYFSSDIIDQLVEAHVLDIYTDKYLISDIYRTDHHTESDRNDGPIQ